MNLKKREERDPLAARVVMLSMILLMIMFQFRRSEPLLPPHYSCKFDFLKTIFNPFKQLDYILNTGRRASSLKTTFHAICLENSLKKLEPALAVIMAKEDTRQ
jgi:hypothetical protein